MRHCYAGYIFQLYLKYHPYKYYRRFPNTRKHRRLDLYLYSLFRQALMYMAQSRMVQINLFAQAARNIRRGVITWSTKI